MSPVTKPRHYHLIGIGGTAMASLAGLLKEAGHTVTGSDENVYPPMSTLLEEKGIPYYEGYRPENVGLSGSETRVEGIGATESVKQTKNEAVPRNVTGRPDVVVVGNAISRGNPELEAVLDARVPYTSAARTIEEEFLRGRVSVAVAGTHGKTTTTSLLAWVLECAGLEPSFLVGGVAENFGSSFRLTGSRYFVIEADEYDTAYFDKGPKMWHYLPDVAIVNNVEFDHADIYRDEEAYRFAFARFINLIPRSGTLVAGWDSPIVRELAPKTYSQLESFGYNGHQDGVAHPRWRAEDVEFGPERTRFTAVHDGVEWGRVEMPLAGAFNVRNALAAIAVAHALGAEPEGVRKGLKTFRSVRRRMEVKGEVRGVTVIDDFAHHPTAVRETLDAVRQRYGERPLVAVFEPRSYTAQRREFQEAYVRAFAPADRVVLAGLFHPERYDAGTALNPEEIVEELRGEGKDAAHIPGVDAIVDHLVDSLEGGEVVLIMSNGGFGGIHRKLLDALAEG
jgi:UDP-N-acetylmuramate: L-alanyl-gamma-D-glutamyl-meso-diaminopimelate ligase